MTNFIFWQDRVQEETQGREVLCVLCFEVKPREQMAPAGDGVVWDVCLPCEEHEQGPREAVP